MHILATPSWASLTAFEREACTFVRFIDDLIVGEVDVQLGRDLVNRLVTDEG